MTAVMHRKIRKEKKNIKSNFSGAYTQQQQHTRNRDAVVTCSDAVVPFSGTVVTGARSSNIGFLCGFCREYEGEYVYGGGLSQNNLWRSRSNNESDGLKAKNMSPIQN